MPSSEVSLVAALAGGAAFGATLALAGVACARSTNAAAATAAAAAAAAPTASGRESQPAATTSGRASTACANEPWQQEVNGTADAPRQKQHQQPADQPGARPSGDDLLGDDEPKHATPPRRARDQDAGAYAASLCLVSPIDFKKRSDPYDTRPRTG
jgi:hypothetical protein